MSQRGVLPFGTDWIVEKIVIGETQTVRKFGLVCPAHGGSFADVK